MDLTEAIRAACGENVLVVWGGVHPTIAPQDCLPYADYVCVGEADRAVVDFVGAWRDGAITRAVPGFNRGRGAATTRGAEAKESSSGPMGAGALTHCPTVEDLDALPVPDHYPSGSFILHRGEVRPMSLGLFQRYGRYRSSYLSVMTTRGCPNQCTYCCNHLLSRICGSTVRRRSARGVLDEIRASLEGYPGRIHYIDLIERIRSSNCLSRPMAA
jgi:anaerobic magnesium-protoporphyrin IX monomethyl ester cyclase